uniref:Bromo domain-containing protein n=1 Tax=Arundo donax TaxID=35708 RepID=A0A0A9CTW6_ARUDO
MPIGRPRFFFWRKCLFRIFHRYMIRSLQSKVKRLKEERERSISGEAAPAVKKEEENDEAALVKGSPEDDDAAGEDRVSGGESGRSCKESNSSDLKRPGYDAGAASAAGDGNAAAREDETAGGGESVAVKREEVSSESVAGSKEEEAAADAEKESSDVQSSASPSRRREREGGGEDAEAEEASASPSAPAALPAAEAEALLAFLESVRTSKLGSLFERRLESQDGAKYRNTIRRHVDLETIRSKLEGGGACYSSASEFYRDLLLLCANALVFFPRVSPEHAAAAQTRALVSRHISASLRKDQPGTSGKAAAGTSAASKKAKAEADVGSLLEKTPIIVCRKRSSIAKAAAAAAKMDKADKGETDKEDEEKENEVKKKVGPKDKARGLRENKSRGGHVRNAAPNQRTGKSSESEGAAEGTTKSDKKGGSGAAATGGVAKKRNAVDFLKRMKQNSTPSTGRVSLLETLKLSAAAEQKSGKGEGRKEPGGGSSSKKATETPPGRRHGRPPKRAAAPPTPPASKRAKGDRSSSGMRKRGGKK